MLALSNILSPDTTHVCFLWARGRQRMKTVIVVHGGAWAIPDELAEASVVGVKNAVRAGDAVLKNGGSALDAVEKAVRSLEDDPTFDAGIHKHTLPGPKKVTVLI